MDSRILLKGITAVIGSPILICGFIIFIQGSMGLTAGNYNGNAPWMVFHGLFRLAIPLVFLISMIVSNRKRIYLSVAILSLVAACINIVLLFVNVLRTDGIRAINIVFIVCEPVFAAMNIILFFRLKITFFKGEIAEDIYSDDGNDVVPEAEMEPEADEQPPNV